MSEWNDARWAALRAEAAAQDPRLAAAVDDARRTCELYAASVEATRRAEQLRADARAGRPILAAIMEEERAAARRAQQMLELSQRADARMQRLARREPAKPTVPPEVEEIAALLLAGGK